MYFIGTLEIDPSQLTKIKPIKKQGFITQFLNAVSFGQLSPKQELETFNATSILQQIYDGFNSIGINNVIRLSMDNYDFYLDETGQENDLDKAVFSFTSRVDPIESELFETIYLVLEHREDNLNFLIEVDVKRKHKVGEYPIFIDINCVFEEFNLSHYKSEEELFQNLVTRFSNQESFDEFFEINKMKFNNFLDKVEIAAKKYIPVDNVIKRSKRVLVRPNQKITKLNQVKHLKSSQPIHYGYPGFDKSAFYIYLWSDLMFKNNLYCSNFFITDEYGNEIFTIGENGFFAKQSNALNTDIQIQDMIEDSKNFPLDYDDNNPDESNKSN
ncbi:MAG: hypothetical protein N2319_10600 [Candidatus Kapabacteria bacterium]|nr:hypothetical protein [Candidatus Kapabacteria bacterium]